ncbi:MAG: sugar kinase [Candidatus Eremiobacteraeota bacterium]|nr:sugar kinase [Candidatus Eremiobacteraeota bacterium]
MIISRAPVRLSMGGGGTDLPSFYEQHGGFLLAAAINKYVYLSINRRFSESIRLSYSKTEIVDRVESIEHNIFREALKLTKIESGIELVSIADVPAQCGLGSSSTFTVALLNGLYAYKRIYLPLERLAESACRLEIGILKEPIGKQDQYASAFGGFNAYTFHKDGTVTVEPVNITVEHLLELQNNLFLFYLKRDRQASSVLTVQDRKSREGDRGTLDRLHRIKEIGIHTRKIFEEGKLHEFGEILHEHWLTKKGLSDKVSDSSIDEVYDHALKNGATGGKVVGAGGGGFLLLYCPKERTRLVTAMKAMGLEPMWFTFEPEGAKIVFHG